MNYDAGYSTYVGNLDCTVPVADLEELIYELFLQAGPVEKVYFPLNTTTGQHKNHGFVEFEHQESVPYAILLLNGVCLFGRPLRVGPVGVFPAVPASADTATTETADAATMETADAAVLSSVPCTGSSALTPQDEVAAAILAAQMLGLPLPVLNEALALPLNGHAPPLSSAYNEQPPNQLSEPTPLFGCAPISASGNVQPPLGQPLAVQNGTTPLFGCTSFSSAGDGTRHPQVQSSSSLQPTPLQLPSSGPTPLFSHLPLSSSNGEMHPTLGSRLSPPPKSHPHHSLPPSSTSAETHFGHRLSPPPSSPAHISLPPSISDEARPMFGPRLSSPPNSPPHLSLLGNEAHPTLGHRLSPPSSSPPHRGLPPSASDKVHPTLGQRMSPPNHFSRNQRPSWEQDDIPNGTSGHSRAWEDTPNHIGDHFWDKPPNHDIGPAPSWEQLPGVANSNHMYRSRSRWSPGCVAEERIFCEDPWEQPSNYHEDTSNSYPFPNHIISSRSRTEEFTTPHSDDAAFSESHPFASDHTHRRMHENRVLHSDDKPLWVTKETKDLIRNHHLTKLTETLVQYQQLYSNTKKC